MGKRGPKPKRADGWHLTARGYLRGWVDGRLRLAHVVEWERHHGPVPAGYQVHHINEVRDDYRIENLQLLDCTTHKRIHGECIQQDGVWLKPCSICKELKPIDTTHWYMSKEGWPLYGRCRPCHIARVVIEKRARKIARAAVGAK